MHESLCVCPLLPDPPIATRTRLVLLIHRLEHRKPTNTGLLAAACLANREVIVRGHEAQPTAPIAWEPGSRPVLLFPFEGATPLADLAPSEKPVTLVVPDGTWRQASKARSRVPGLREVPCVSLPPGDPSSYRLRGEAHPTGLATIEAIARALGLLEGEMVRRALERVFRAMVERTLWLRGTIPTRDVEGGIPEAALAHDPRGAMAGSGVRID